MAFNSRSANPKLAYSKNFVSDQTLNGVTLKSTSSTFDATRGLGLSTANSGVILANAGGFPNQQITAVMRYVAPTAQGAEDFGVIARVMSFDSPNQTYYYFRCNAGLAKITRVIANTFVTLTQSAFALGQDTNVTIAVTVNGTSLSATFTAASGPSQVTLSTTDSNIPGALGQSGSFGTRSLTSTFYTLSLVGGQI